MTNIEQKQDDVFFPAFFKANVIRRLLVLLAIPLMGAVVVVISFIAIIVWIATGDADRLDKWMDKPDDWMRWIGGV